LTASNVTLDCVPHASSEHASNGAEQTAPAYTAIFVLSDVSPQVEMSTMNVSGARNRYQTSLWMVWFPEPLQRTFAAPSVVAPFVLKGYEP
jgi:hypothetical protein